MAVLIAPKLKLDAVLEAANPTECIEGSGGPVILGTPVESVDGRLVWVHPFDEVTRAWLECRMVGIAGATIIEEMPADWVPVAQA